MKKNLSGFLQTRFTFFLFKALSRNPTLIYILIRILGELYYLLNRKEKQAKITEIATFNKDKKIDVEKVFGGIFWHYCEKFHSLCATPDELKNFFAQRVIDNGTLNRIIEGRKKGKGVLFITGHFIGVEYISHYLALSQKIPVSIVAKFSSNRLLELSQELAHDYNGRIINTDKEKNIPRAIIHDLNEDRIVIILCDEIPKWKATKKKNNGTINFLNQEIYLDKNLDRIIKLCVSYCDPAIVFGTMLRDENKYKFNVTPWEEMIKETGADKNTPAGEIVLKFLEILIYRYPYLWYQWGKCRDLPCSDPSLKILSTSSLPSRA